MQSPLHKPGLSGQLRGTSDTSLTIRHKRLGTIQVLRNAVGGGRVSDFPEKSLMKMYGSTLLAGLLVGGEWVGGFRISRKRHYVTRLQWPLTTHTCTKLTEDTAAKLHAFSLIEIQE